VGLRNSKILSGFCEIKDTGEQKSKAPKFILLIRVDMVLKNPSDRIDSKYANLP
jgi:hypothetical protein